MCLWEVVVEIDKVLLIPVTLLRPHIIFYLFLITLSIRDLHFQEETSTLHRFLASTKLLTI